MVIIIIITMIIYMFIQDKLFSINDTAINKGRVKGRLEA